MRPDLDVILQGSFLRMVMEVAPRLGPDYLSGSANTIGMMLLAGAVEYERGAEVRHAENETLRTLLRDGSARLPPGHVRARLESAAHDQAPSLRISDLNAVNARLRAALIELQSAVEAIDDAWARDFELDAWVALARAAEARRIELPV